MDDPREHDLFGNPVRERKGLRGRPPIEVTEKDLDMLEAGLMKGWSNQRLAKVLGIGISTLKRNFGPLLSGRGDAPDRLRLAMFATTARKAIEGGDMGAMRQLRQMISEDEVVAARHDLMHRQSDDDDVRTEKLGKKEAAKRAANSLGGDDVWGDDLIPQARPN